MSEFKCTLWPSQESFSINGREPLLVQLKRQGKDIKSSCGGCATCGDCVIVVKTGEENLTPQTFEELRLLGNIFHITKERLSCQTKVTGDVTIDISKHEKKSLFANDKAAVVPNGPKTMLKKRQDIAKVESKSQDIPAEKKDPSWYRHWEKDKPDESKAKKIGGNKRPKAFKNPNESDS